MKMDDLKSDVECLNDEAYHKALAGLMAEDQYVNNHKLLLKKAVNEYKGRPVSILSIGAGSGYYDKYMLTELGLDVSHIHVIEPNTNFNEELRETLASAGVSFAIENAIFDESYLHKNAYDIILFLQSLYYMENYTATLHNASKMLRDNGTIIVVLQGDEAPPKQWSLVLSESNLNINLSHLLSIDDVIDGLNKVGIYFEILGDIKTPIDIDHFIRGVGSLEQRNQYVDHCIDLEYKNLPGNVRENLLQKIKRDSYLDEDTGKYMCYTYVAGIRTKTK